MLGRLQEGRIELHELHRFANQPVRVHSTLYWDVLRLFLEIKEGLRRGAERCGGNVDGVAVDSWGVDYAVLDKAGNLLGNPVHYRDARTEGMMARVFERLPKDDIFGETGLQFLELNTIYQLAAHRDQWPESWSSAACILLVADLISYFLCGAKFAERTLASTTQLWNPVSRDWSTRLASALEIQSSLLPPLVDPGTVVGTLRADLARDAGFRTPPPVIASCSHDTAAAVAAVPADEGDNWAFISSGTWCMLGVELGSPRMRPEVLAANFTNEAGIDGTTRFLRNLNGLWLVQECQRSWCDEDGHETSHAELTRWASEVCENRSFISPNHGMFFAPKNMPEAIRDFCRRSAQEVPDSRGHVLRCALESLALSFRGVMARAEELSGRSVERVHIVGGGSQNVVLNQLIANALGRPLIAGPAEATATGNVLVQAKATGSIRSLSELRTIVRTSADPVEYLPKENAAWAEKAKRYGELVDLPITG